MKLLRITAQGFPLFKQNLDILFYAQQRVSEDDRARLYRLTPSVYLHAASAFIGINASGKTSILKVIRLALGILNNEPINHVPEKIILGGTNRAVLRICYSDAEQKICCLETEISSERTRSGEYIYAITAEHLWEKPAAGLKKNLTDFTGISPVAERDNREMFLPDDVSFIIARNRQRKDHIEIASLLSYTNMNVLPFSADIPIEVISFLDPTVERLKFEREGNKTFIHLKFYNEDEILLNSPLELENYLSSGTIKGIVTFSMVKDVLQSGGYLLIDEIENHFNKEIVTTMIRFFMDSFLNRKGGTLIFTTHYPELLDEYDRNDGIYIVRNRSGITAENLSNILKRNDIKKSDAYQSGFLEGTTPAYEAYLQLKKSLSASV